MVNVSIFNRHYAEYLKNHITKFGIVKAIICNKIQAFFNLLVECLILFNLEDYSDVKQLTF